MASSQLAICNLALALIGDKRLASMTDVRLARITAEDQYEGAIRTALSRHSWRFADVKVTLSQLVTAPLNEFSYAYQIPADCCRVNRVYPDSNYEIYGDQIFSNQSALAMDYERRRPNPELEAIMPPHFERYAAHELVPLIVVVLTSDDAKQKLAEQYRVQALGECTSIDAQQRPNRTFRHSPFIDARRGPRRF